MSFAHPAHRFTLSVTAFARSCACSQARMDLTLAPIPLRSGPATLYARVYAGDGEERGDQYIVIESACATMFGVQTITANGIAVSINVSKSGDCRIRATSYWDGGTRRLCDAEIRVTVGE